MGAERQLPVSGSTYLCVIGLVWGSGTRRAVTSFIDVGSGGEPKLASCRWLDPAVGTSRGVEESSLLQGYSGVTCSRGEADGDGGHPSGAYDVLVSDNICPRVVSPTNHAQTWVLTKYICQRAFTYVKQTYHTTYFYKSQQTGADCSDNSFSGDAIEVMAGTVNRLGGNVFVER